MGLRGGEPGIALRPGGRGGLYLALQKSQVYLQWIFPDSLMREIDVTARTSSQSNQRPGKGLISYQISARVQIVLFIKYFNFKKNTLGPGDMIQWVGEHSLPACDLGSFSALDGPLSTVWEQQSKKHKIKENKIEQKTSGELGHHSFNLEQPQESNNL